MRFILIILLSLLASCSSLNDPAQSTATVRYDTLIIELQQSINPAKIIAARQLYLSTYHAVQLDSEKQLIQEIEAAIVENNWHDCLADNNTLLAFHYTSLFAHYSAMVCHYELQQPERSQYHQQMLNAILEAFWLIGNGEQTDSAFFAINEQDIKSFIEFHGLELKAKTLLSQPNEALVKAEVYDAAKNEQFVWFFRLANVH